MLQYLCVFTWKIIHFKWRCIFLIIFLGSLLMHHGQLLKWHWRMRAFMSASPSAVLEQDGLRPSLTFLVRTSYFHLCLANVTMNYLYRSKFAKISTISMSLKHADFTILCMTEWTFKAYTLKHNRKHMRIRYIWGKLLRYPTSDMPRNDLQSTYV